MNAKTLVCTSNHSLKSIFVKILKVAGPIEGILEAIIRQDSKAPSGLSGIAFEVLGKIQFGLDEGEEFAVFSRLLPGEFAVLAADGAVALVYLFRGGEFGFNAGDGGGEVLLGEFAFPDGDDGPGEGVEALGAQFIAGDVAGHFLLPEAGVAFRDDIFGAAAVAVPEAAVDEDDGTVLGEDEVGRAGQTSVVEPVAITATPQFVPDGPLGSRILRADAGHVVGSLGGRWNCLSVSHNPSGCD